jgi:DNA-binding winged helix-turn-helix (wHTH) protein
LAKNQSAIFSLLFPFGRFTQSIWNATDCLGKVSPLRKAELLDNIFRFAHFEADRVRYQLWSETRPIKLERIPLELLFLLLENRGKLVARTQIVDKLWGDDLFLDTERSINTAIRKVRKALEDDTRHPRFIETVIGRGYRFIAPLGSENEIQNPRNETFSAATPAAIQIGTQGADILLRSFSVETTGGSTVLTCDVVVSKIPLGRIRLLELDLPNNMTLPLELHDRLLLKLHGMRATLAPQAAQVLHAFSLSVLQRGSRTRVTDSFHLSGESHGKHSLQFATEELNRTGDSGAVKPDQLPFNADAMPTAV